VENVKPHLAGGKHEVVDEKFDNRGEYRETREGEVE
jgi:hypothetical protein